MIEKLKQWWQKCQDLLDPFAHNRSWWNVQYAEQLVALSGMPYDDCLAVAQNDDSAYTFLYDAPQHAAQLEHQARQDEEFA